MHEIVYDQMMTRLKKSVRSGGERIEMTFALQLLTSAEQAWCILAALELSATSKSLSRLPISRYVLTITRIISVAITDSNVSP